MHILETYALSCGLKIDRPYVYENYTTVPFEKFISFNKINYPFFPEVVALLKPELDKRGIGILQLKASQNNIETEVAVFENHQFGQYAYLVKHSLLHFGEDDFLFDLCGYYDIPRVVMFSNTYPATSKPYWGSPEKEIILSTTGPWQKPSLNAEPSQSFVRYIKPEQVASAVMKLLGIEWQAPYQTIYPGSLYRAKHDIVEVIPVRDTKWSIGGPIASLSIRMDYVFDEQFLSNVLQQTRATIITNKPIQIPLIQALRNHIHEIHYIVDETSHDVNFARTLSGLNIPHQVGTFLPRDKSGPLIEEFFETCPISHIPISNLADIKELKSGVKGYWYKSAKRILTGMEECKSRFENAHGMKSNANDLSPCPDAPDADFLKELEFFFVVKPT